MSLPKIFVIALGGTIAATRNDANRPASMILDAAGILSAVPEAAEIAEINAETFRQTGSADLSFSDVVELSNRIRLEVSAGVDGFVITQGTDTLEETAFLLDRLLSLEVPLVVTGAMRHSTSPGADGPANLISAIRVAASPEARDSGVLVVMNNEVHLARFVTKAHATSVSAFNSPLLGPVGYIAEDRVRIPLKPRVKHKTFVFDTKQPLPKVALVPFAFDYSTDLIDAVAGARFDGTVFEAFGAGHTSSRYLDSLARISDMMPTVYASGSGVGEVHIKSCDFPGSELRLLERGLIPAFGMNSAKARLLLCLLIAVNAERPAIAAEFEMSAL